VCIVESVAGELLRVSMQPDREFLLLGLHDMVVRKPLELMMAFVDRRWVQAHGLIVGAISEPFSPRTSNPG
jgi:hypothetical protein